MGDLFDDFMRELERRRAEAEGRAPKDDSGDPKDPDDPDQPEPDEDDRANDDGAPPDEPAADDDEPATTDDGDEQQPAAAAGAARPTLPGLPPATPQRGHAAAEDGRPSRRRAR